MNRVGKVRPHRVLYTIVYSSLLIVAMPLVVFSQTDPIQSETKVLQEVKPPPLPEFRYSVSWSSENGSHLFVPGKWSELYLHFANARQQPREFLSATYFDLEPSLQFGRRVWVPARSTLRIPQPILVPSNEQAKTRSLDLHSLLFDTSEGNEVLLKSNQGPLLHDATLLVTPTLRNTAVIGNSGNGFDVPPRDVAELIMATRVSQELNHKLTSWTDQFLPADERFFSSVDHIILLDDRIAHDCALLSTIRPWLNGGGHLWVMLDQASPIVLETILGDDFQGHVVDHVSLTSVRIDRTPTVALPEGKIGETQDYDDAINFVRMKIPNFEVTHSVNGWPAAMTRPYGDGRIFITTLGARAWLRPKPNNFRESDDETMRSRLVPIPPMKDLADEIFSQRQPNVLPTEVLEPPLREYIGYAIPSWGFVIGSLAGCLAILFALGLFLIKIQRLEYLAGLGSLMAIAVSGLFLFVGHSYRHGIPGTIATLQMTEAMPGTDAVRGHGLVAVYHPEGSSSKIQITSGGEIMPDMTGLESSNRRLITTDLGTAYWDNLNQPAGLRMSAFRQSQLCIDRLEAHATFDANGIVGRYSGSTAPGSDALIATREGRIGTSLKPDGSFVARADHVLEKDQFLDAGLMSDEQSRRRLTLQSLFTNSNRKDYPNRPQLMFWTDHVGHGFQFDDSLQSRGATLVTVPLTFDRPSNGTEFVIPSTLLPFRNRIGPDGTPPASMWNYHRKEWQERSKPGASWLRFQIPRELLPLTLRRARIDVDVSGPIGRLEIMGLKNGQVVSLETKMDPVGSLSFEISDAHVLTVTDDGTISLAVSAGDPARPELTQAPQDETMGSGSNTGVLKKASASKVNFWRIESLRLQLWAKSTE